MGVNLDLSGVYMRFTAGELRVFFYVNLLVLV